MMVLIVVFLAGYGPRPDVRFQEFTSAASCEVAKQTVISAWKVNNDSRVLNSAVCVPK